MNYSLISTQRNQKDQHTTELLVLLANCSTYMEQHMYYNHVNYNRDNINQNRIYI